jgi:hypothetical protein
MKVVWLSNIKMKVKELKVWCLRSYHKLLALFCKVTQPRAYPEQICWKSEIAFNFLQLLTQNWAPYHWPMKTKFQNFQDPMVVYMSWKFQASVANCLGGNVPARALGEICWKSDIAFNFWQLLTQNLSALPLTYENQILDFSRSKDRLHVLRISGFCGQWFWRSCAHKGPGWNGGIIIRNSGFQNIAMLYI